MSQFGMQMPGGRVRRTATVNVYTALLLISAIALATACAFMWQAGTSVADPQQGVMAPLLGVQEQGRISLPN
jgi:hypothetical protein